MVNIIIRQKVLSGSGGVTTFTGLTDTPSSLSGESLKFVRVNAGETALEFAASSASVAELNDIGDVTITTITSGEILKWNGSAFINNTLAEAGIAAASHTHTASEVTDLASATVTFTNKSGNISQWTNDSGYITDYTVTEGDVTAHQAALSITASQVSDFDTEVANNSAVTANTAKVTNATHTGDATGSTALTVVKLRGVDLDSTVGSPSDGDILVYRSAGSDWVLETKPAGGSNPAINDITDITITSVADNEVLAYNSGTGEWINQTAAEAGLASSSHTHTLSDITDSGSLAALSAVDADSVTVSNLEVDNLKASSVVLESEGISSNDNDTTLPTSAAVKDYTDTALAAQSEAIVIPVSDETTALTTGTAKVTFRMPFAMTLTAVRASVTTAPTGSVLTVDLNESGTTVLSTKLTIDATEKTSTTAATAAVISDSALADDAEITIDIDGVGSTVAGAGLKVTLIGTRA